MLDKDDVMVLVIVSFIFFFKHKYIIITMFHLLSHYQLFCLVFVSLSVTKALNCKVVAGETKDFTCRCVQL